MFVVLVIKEIWIKELIGFLFNMIRVDLDFVVILIKFVGVVRDVREIWIKGFVGFMDINLEKEFVVMGLVLVCVYYI